VTPKNYAIALTLPIVLAAKSSPEYQTAQRDALRERLRADNFR